jgi:hypothetical protein
MNFSLLKPSLRALEVRKVRNKGDFFDEKMTENNIVGFFFLFFGTIGRETKYHKS